MAMTQKEMISQLRDAYRLIDDAMDMLDDARMLADDVRNALTDEHPAIHQDLVEVRWFDTAEVQPDNGQKVIVRTPTGEVFFLTYPFSHTKYPQWWVIPQASK